MVMLALLIWCAFSIPVALVVGRMLRAADSGAPPGPPVILPPARDLVRS